MRRLVGKKICQYDLDGNYIKTWDSIAEAAEELNINYSTLQTCLGLRSRRAGKYMWCYLNEVPEEKIESYKPPKEEQVKKKLYQYDLNGKLIRTWESLGEASEALGVAISSISRVNTGKKPTAGGFIWRYEKEAPEQIEVGVLDKQKKPVKQFSLEGAFIKEWESVSEAGKQLRINISHISGVCRGNRRTAGNYIWKYKEDLK